MYSSYPSALSLPLERLYSDSMSAPERKEKLEIRCLGKKEGETVNWQSVTARKEGETVKSQSISAREEGETVKWLSVLARKKEKP